MNFGFDLVKECMRSMELKEKDVVKKAILQSMCSLCITSWGKVAIGLDLFKGMEGGNSERPSLCVNRQLYSVTLSKVL